MVRMVVRDNHHVTRGIGLGHHLLDGAAVLRIVRSRIDYGDAATSWLPKHVGVRPVQCHVAGVRGDDPRDEFVDTFDERQRAEGRQLPSQARVDRGKVHRRYGAGFSGSRPTMVFSTESLAGRGLKP